MDYFLELLKTIPGISTIIGAVLVIISIAGYLISKNSDELFTQKIAELRKGYIKPSDFKNTEWNSDTIKEFFSGTNQIPSEFLKFMKEAIHHEVKLRNRKLLITFTFGVVLVLFSAFWIKNSSNKPNDNNTTEELRDTLNQKDTLIDMSTNIKSISYEISDRLNIENAKLIIANQSNKKTKQITIKEKNKTLNIIGNDKDLITVTFENSDTTISFDFLLPLTNKITF